MHKSMLIYQKDSKGIVKSNFVTSRLAFGGLIPTLLSSITFAVTLSVHW